MNRLKMKVLDELIDHLSDSQGGELKSAWDESRMPPKGVKVESIEVLGKPKMEEFDDRGGHLVADNSGDKKRTVGEIIGYPGFPKPPKEEGMKASLSKPTAMLEEMPEGEMSDDEFKELMKKYMTA